MARGEKIAFKMWLFPGLTWATIVFIVGILTVMLIRPDHRIEIVATGLLSIAVVAAGLLVARKRKAEAAGRLVLNN
ncbi:GABA permease [compost metagenome]